MKKKSSIQIYLTEQALVISISVLGLAQPLLAHANVPNSKRDSDVAVVRQSHQLIAPAEGDGEGIAVRLEMPWRVLLKHEIFTFLYVLENRSKHPIPIAFPGGEPFGWPNGGQAFLEGILQTGAPEPESARSDFPWLKVHEATWPPLDEDRNVVETWGSLPPGQRVAWNQNRLRAQQNFRVYSTKHLKAIQGHWLVGKGRWVSSKLVTVEVRDVPENEWIKVFEGEWSSYGRGLNHRIIRVLKIPLDGKWYLFSDFMVRICEVGEKDEFEFKIEPEIGQLVVTVKSPAGEKKHYYHMQHGLTRDIPWKAGPVSQYYPVPEPIPEADLALPVLATKVATNGEKPGEASTVEAAGRPLWPWIFGALLLVVALAGAWMRLRGRNA